MSKKKNHGVHSTAQQSLSRHMRPGMELAAGAIHSGGAGGASPADCNTLKIMIDPLQLTASPYVVPAPTTAIGNYGSSTNYSTVSGGPNCPPLGVVKGARTYISVTSTVNGDGCLLMSSLGSPYSGVDHSTIIRNKAAWVSTNIPASANLALVDPSSGLTAPPALARGEMAKLLGATIRMKSSSMSVLETQGEVTFGVFYDAPNSLTGLTEMQAAVWSQTVQMSPRMHDIEVTVPPHSCWQRCIAGDTFTIGNQLGSSIAGPWVVIVWNGCTTSALIRFEIEHVYVYAGAETPREVPLLWDDVCWNRCINATLLRQRSRGGLVEKTNVSRKTAQREAERTSAAITQHTMSGSLFKSVAGTVRDYLPMAANLAKLFL